MPGGGRPGLGRTARETAPEARSGGEKVEEKRKSPASKIPAVVSSTVSSSAPKSMTTSPPFSWIRPPRSPKSSIPGSPASLILSMPSGEVGDHILPAGEHEDVRADAAGQHLVAVTAGQAVAARAAVEACMSMSGSSPSPAVIVSLPARPLTTRASVVPMSRLNGDEVHPVEVDPRAVRRHREVVGIAVGAVDDRPVEADPAFHDVAAVAVVPDHRVVPEAAEHGVAAAEADQHVVVVVSGEQVVAVAAHDRVVAGAASRLQLDQPVEARGAGDRVVAAKTVHHEGLGGADVEAERARGSAGRSRPGRRSARW